MVSVEQYSKRLPNSELKNIKRLILVFAMFLHMTCGCLLGYLGAKLCRLPEDNCRTISIEVGMQNGGLASGIAVQMGKIATVGLAAAINGPIMNAAISR